MRRVGVGIAGSEEWVDRRLESFRSPSDELLMSKTTALFMKSNYRLCNSDDISIGEGKWQRRSLNGSGC